MFGDQYIDSDSPLWSLNLNVLLEDVESTVWKYLFTNPIQPTRNLIEIR